MDPFRIHSISITPEILRLISEIDEFKGAWSALGRLAPERLATLRRASTIESVGSAARMAGARLSDEEVERLMFNVEHDTRGSDADIVAGYAAALARVLVRGAETVLTEQCLRALHGAVLSRAANADHGTLGIHGEALALNGRRVDGVEAPAFDAPCALAELAAWTQQRLDAKDFHPLLVIAISIAAFIAIRPFESGNGRLSRLLATLLLLRANYAYVPFSSLERVIEQSQDHHDVALRLTASTVYTQAPDWQPWLSFFLTALQQQKLRLETTIERERQVYGSLPTLSAQILGVCRERGRITVAEAVRATGANRNTIKDHLRALVRAGHVALHGAGRGAWYGLP